MGRVWGVHNKIQNTWNKVLICFLLYYMSKIYTKTGDAGKTSMLGGKRVSKSCLEMEAIGEVDELNAFLGILIEEIEDDFKREKDKLINIQHCLFVIGANIASVQTDLKQVKKLGNKEIEKLETWIDKMDGELSKLKNFILPGGSEEASKSFYARAICRRAERQVVALNQRYKIDKNIIKYLNRLSDLLFVLGRWINFKGGVKEVKWKR